MQSPLNRNEECRVYLSNIKEGNMKIYFEIITHYQQFVRLNQLCSSICRAVVRSVTYKEQVGILSWFQKII